MPIVSELGVHEGKPIRKTSIEVRNIAGGLHKATKTDPAVINVGERVYVLAEVIGDAHTFKPMDDGDAWERINITNADTVTIVDYDIVGELVEAQRAKNVEVALEEQRVKEEAKGVQRMTADKGDPVEAHQRGDHKRKRKDCPECVAELAEAKRIAEEQKPAKKAAAKPRKSRARGNLSSVK